MTRSSSNERANSRYDDGAVLPAGMAFWPSISMAAGTRAGFTGGYASRGIISNGLGCYGATPAWPGARDPVAEALKAFGDRHGFDAEGLVVDELLDDGSVQKSSRRCWPHTEAIKAEVAAFEAGDTNAGARAARVIDRLMQVFLGRPVAGGWVDHIDANGAPLVDFMPASTFYHVFLALAEAHRVWR